MFGDFKGDVFQVVGVGIFDDDAVVDYFHIQGCFVLN
jgi:hypothetical protein